MAAYVLRWSQSEDQPDRVWLVGPFIDCELASTWGQVMDDALDNPFWQVVELNEPEQPDRYTIPIFSPA